MSSSGALKRCPIFEVLPPPMILSAKTTMGDKFPKDIYHSIACTRM
jgi:hypothetical protein